MGCHFLLQCRKVKSESEVAQLCPTLNDPMNYSLPGSSIHGIFQARILEGGAIAFSSQHSLDHRKSKSILQHHSSKASILWHSAFFIIQLSHPYITTGKTIALTRWMFVPKRSPTFQFEERNGTWNALCDPKSYPTYMSHLRETPRFTAALHLSHFSPPDRHRRVESSALSGRVS